MSLFLHQFNDKIISGETQMGRSLPAIVVEESTNEIIVKITCNVSPKVRYQALDQDEYGDYWQRTVEDYLNGPYFRLEKKPCVFGGNMKCSGSYHGFVDGHESEYYASFIPSTFPEQNRTNPDSQAIELEIKKLLNASIEPFKERIVELEKENNKLKEILQTDY
jgi:hypothetical protein